jgi:transcriptional regulator with XRE-family HTH domain
MAIPERTLGQRLQKLRTARGLTRRALAARAGVSVVYIEKLEADERIPTIPTLKRLAAAVGARLVLDLKQQRRGTDGR